jgi:cation:H+ antiporter
MLDYWLFAGGLVTLIYGGDRLVASAVRIAAARGLSPLAVGAVIVGLGTSAPELVTSLDAALLGLPGIALGNVIGSNIANILLILGLAATYRPLSIDPASAKRDIIYLLIATALVLWALHTSQIERWMGFGLVILLGVYIATLLRATDGATAEANIVAKDSRDTGIASETSRHDAIWAIVGISLLVGGAHYMVQGAIGIAEDFGISEATTGLILLALGTSLPELTVTLIALARNESELAIGNALGSTLFNLLGILGTTAMLVPLAVPAEILGVHVWVMTAAIVVLCIFLRTGWRLNRWEGLVLLGAYPTYLATAFR